MGTAATAATVGAHELAHRSPAKGTHTQSIFQLK